MGCLKLVGDENPWKWVGLVRLKFSQSKRKFIWTKQSSIFGVPNVNFPDLLPCLFSPNNPQGAFFRMRCYSDFSGNLVISAMSWGWWIIFSYSGMGEVFVLRCILNPTKNYTLLRKRIHIRIVQPKKNTLKIMIVFSFSHFGYLCCFIEGYPKTRWWCQTNVSNFHFVGKGNPSWRTRICFKWVGERPPTI